jgi:flocculation protein FLO11
MKKLFVATMMLVSGMTFGQQEQTTKPEETQPAITKTDISSDESKMVKGKDLKSLEGKSFKIKLTARAASEKKTAPTADATLQNTTGNVTSTSATPSPTEGQAISSSQQVNANGSTGKETEGKAGEVNPANSAATTPVQVTTTPEGQREIASQNVNQNQTDKNGAVQNEPEKTGISTLKTEYDLPQGNSSAAQKEISSESSTAATTGQAKTDDPSVSKDPSQQPAGIAQPDLSQNQNSGAVTANPSSPGIVEETNKVNNEQTAVAAPAIEKSFENKTVIITLKDGNVSISADDMQFESCPYQVTSGTGSLITFTASCKGADPADQIWWSGLIDGTTIRGSLLTKAPVGGESTDYTFKGTKTNAPKKRADQKETSLR